MRFNDLMDKYPSPFFVIEPIYNEKGEMINFRYIFVNEAFARFVGKSKKELLHNDFISVFGNVFEIDWMRFFSIVVEKKGFIAEARFTSVLNRTVVIESFYMSPKLCANFIRDYYTNPVDQIVPNRTTFDILRRANYDYMTNFYNISYLKDNETLIQNSRNIGLVFMDINGLKKVNDEQGNKAGDKLIFDFTNYIRTSFVGGDFFRLGGDDFLVIIMGLDEVKFEELCNKVLNELNESKVGAIGFKFFEEISNLSEAVGEVNDRMHEHKKQMRKMNGKK